jgi:hypothetical protein
LHERRAIREENYGQLGVIELLLAEKVQALGVLFGIEPLEGNQVA